MSNRKPDRPLVSVRIDLDPETHRKAKAKAILADQHLPVWLAWAVQLAVHELEGSDVSWRKEAQNEAQV